MMGTLGKVSNIDSKYIVISAFVITSLDLVQTPQDTSTARNSPKRTYKSVPGRGWREVEGGGGRCSRTKEDG